MPRKTKEQIEKYTNINIKNDIKKSTVKNASSPKSGGKKVTKDSETQMPSKTLNVEAVTENKQVRKSKTNSAKKEKAVSAKTASKEKDSKSSATSKKSKTNSKITNKAKTQTTKKGNKTTAKKSKSTMPVINEYYDLPYRYNQTTVKVLAQTPNNLFIYWDISDEDRENFKKQYGENFFEITKPILTVYNETLGYSFEVEINDFANSWYLHINDSKSKYKIELGRKPINQENFKNSVHQNNIEYNISANENASYIYITTSNNIEAPNDKILFNKNQKMVYYRNVKTNQEFSKDIKTLSFMQNIGKIYGFFKKNGFVYQQYIPCLDPFGQERGTFDYSLTPERYGDFLIKLFDLWYTDFMRGEYISIRWFDALVHMCKGRAPGSCGMLGVCTPQLVVEADGGVYPCDFYVLDKLRLGTVGVDTPAQWEEKRKTLGFIEQSKKVEPECRACRWAPLCRGGCRRDREQPDGSIGLNYLCPAFQRFFAHAAPRLAEIAKRVP